jgi:hypothetical protein
MLFSFPELGLSIALKNETRTEIVGIKTWRDILFGEHKYGREDNIKTEITVFLDVTRCRNLPAFRRNVHIQFQRVT